MNNEIDEQELELEQLDYLRRNYDKTMNIPNSVDMNLDILENPIDDRIILTPEQEKRLVQEVIRQQKINDTVVTKKKHHGFSLAKYFDILSESFVDMMDDILNFDGDMENISKIVTKDDRLVLVGTVIFIISIFIIFTKRSQI